MAFEVDPFRFIDGPTKKMINSRLTREPEHQIHFTPLSKLVSSCRIAMISTAAIALKSDRPFDAEIERQDPWGGDSSHRVIPADASTKDLETYHLHINTHFPDQDINCLLPLQRLKLMQENNEVGSIAPSHYSYMGYQLREQVLLDETTPQIVDSLINEQVDIVLLVPV